MKITVPQEVLSICQALREAGHVAYPVGGCVRDCLLGSEPSDWDVATSAPIEISLSVFKSMSEVREAVPTGDSFPVCRVKFVGGGEYEIATFRKDHGTGKNTTSTYGTIDDDVKRRDLTVNALFYDTEKNTVVDLVGGCEDLNSRVIRFVGSPKDRIDEDRVRVLRAVRMASRFAFSFHPETREAIYALDIVGGEKSDRVPFERIFLEFIKAEEQTRLYDYFSTLQGLELLQQLFPGLKLAEIKDAHGLCLTVASILVGNDPKKVYVTLVETCKWPIHLAKSIEFLITCLKFEGKDVSNYLKKYRATSLVADEVEEFAALFLEENRVKFVGKLCTYVEQISGDDLLKKGYQGSELGRIKKQLEDELFYNEFKFLI